MLGTPLRKIGATMSIRSYLEAKWPELLAIGSLGLIALFVWQRFIAPRWRQPHPTVHLSSFAYRDVNRNGVYDMEDRPYAGLKVTMERPKGGPVEQEGNIAGFANFDMSLGNRKAEVYLPGEYTVRVVAPPDWEVTSSNTVQTLHIEKREGSAVGLILARTLDAVGVAPRLKISGSLDAALASANPKLKATGPDGKESAVAVSKDGTYTLPATPGSWRLEGVSSNGALVARSVLVGRYPVVVSRLDSQGGAFPPKPNARVIGFDDLTPSDTLYEIPNGYQGLNWRNWVATHQKLYQGNGYINAAISSEYVAYTSGGHPATFSSPKMFDFVGAYVGMAWSGGEPHDVVVKAWRNEAEVYRDRFKASTAGPVWFDADYRSVTRVEFSSEGYWQVVVDDLACRTE